MEPIIEKALRAGSAASNSFAFRLYGQVGAKPGNTFFSPASIAVALAMTGLGAGGKTREEDDVGVRLPRE